MAYENTKKRACIREGESSTATDEVSTFLIFLALNLAFLLMIGIFHPGI